MRLHELPLEQVDSQLLDEGVAVLRSEVDGRLEALRSVLVVMQLGVYPAALAPQLA